MATGWLRCILALALAFLPLASPASAEDRYGEPAMAESEDPDERVGETEDPDDRVGHAVDPDSLVVDANYPRGERRAKIIAERNAAIEAANQARAEYRKLKDR